MTSFNPKDLLPKSASTTATKRSGVGSTKTQHQNISEDWTKFGKRQILSIGNNKKRHNQQHDDIEEDDNIDIDNESNSDEEEGRTSAVREKKKRKVVANVSSTHQIDVLKTNSDGDIQGTSADSTVDIISTTNTKKKKKKKGKKERAKDKDTSIEQPSHNENTTDAQQSISKEVVASGKDAKETTATTKDGSITNNNAPDNTATNTTTNTKRKRKKVRSRQKNIRKDNREVKPSHLIVGNDDYKGRPMTKETCEKLGIQSKKSEDGKKNLKRKGNVALFESGQWVGDGEDKNDITTNDDETAKNTTGEEDIKQPKEDVGDTLTRIGDCIVGNSSSNIDNDDTTNKDDVGENILNEDSKKKKGKKQKKRKFKNLVVG